MPVLSETSDEGDAADEALRVAAERKDAAVTVQEKQDAVVAFELAKANKKLVFLALYYDVFTIFNECDSFLHNSYRRSALTASTCSKASRLSR